MIEREIPWPKFKLLHLLTRTFFSNQDPRLKKLWQDSVHNKVFDGDELEKLYHEFKHHESKLVEYDALKEQRETMKGLMIALPSRLGFFTPKISFKVRSFD